MCSDEHLSLRWRVSVMASITGVLVIGILLKGLVTMHGCPIMFRENILLPNFSCSMGFWMQPAAKPRAAHHIQLFVTST